jgi:hypothetical protein
MDFGAIDDDVFGCCDAQTDLIAFDTEHLNSDLGVNDERFVRTAAENQHNGYSCKSLSVKSGERFLHQVRRSGLDQYAAVWFQRTGKEIETRALVRNLDRPSFEIFRARAVCIGGVRYVL